MRTSSLLELSFQLVFFHAFTSFGCNVCSTRSSPSYADSSLSARRNKDNGWQHSSDSELENTKKHKETSHVTSRVHIQHVSEGDIRQWGFLTHPHGPVKSPGCGKHGFFFSSQL
ncbi:hypothetical protein E2320_008233 [Naja naja]|nr:hypothetical protein E2320_008233 [Naja naja]